MFGFVEGKLNVMIVTPALRAYYSERAEILETSKKGTYTFYSKRKKEYIFFLGRKKGKLYLFFFKKKRPDPFLLRLNLSSSFLFLFQQQSSFH